MRDARITEETIAAHNVQVRDLQITSVSVANWLEPPRDLPVMRFPTPKEITMRSLRRTVADWLDPTRGRRETDATKRALGYRQALTDAQRAAQAAAGPLLITSNVREASDILGRHHPSQSMTVHDVIAGRARGLTLTGYITTNLALQHTDWPRAEQDLQICLLANTLGRTP